MTVIAFLTLVSFGLCLKSLMQSMGNEAVDHEQAAALWLIAFFVGVLVLRGGS